jgi:hypothetical protein
VQLAVLLHHLGETHVWPSGKGVGRSPSVGSSCPRTQERTGTVRCAMPVSAYRPRR